MQVSQSPRSAPLLYAFERLFSSQHDHIAQLNNFARIVCVASCLSLSVLSRSNAVAPSRDYTEERQRVDFPYFFGLRGSTKLANMGSNATMDAIKKKMQAMKVEKETAFDKCDQLEQKLVEQKVVFEKSAEEISSLQKRIVALEADTVAAKSSLEEQNQKVEAASQDLASAEAEVQNLTKKVRELEEQFEATEDKLKATSEKLEQASKAADDSERGIKVLESKMVMEEERIQQLEKELEETIMAGEDSDRRFEETFKKLASTDMELTRAEASYEAADAKVLELEEELHVVTNNMKSLEISEQEFYQREEEYEERIAALTEGLKNAEQRCADAENYVQMLQKEVDKLDDELAAEKEKYKTIDSELNATFAELTGF